MIDENDWRLQGQEKYLQGIQLTKKRYSAPRQDWDHDHCEFCSKKFSNRSGDQSIGYTTDDEYHWICEDCFSDFREMFGWKLN